MREVFRFLGVDETFTSPDWDAEHNPRPERRRRRHTASVVGWMTRKWGARRVVALKRRVPRPVYLALTAELEEPVLEEGLRERLAEHFAPDVARLRAFTGRPFAGWSV
jgi:hypothetical protein